MREKNRAENMKVDERHDHVEKSIIKEISDRVCNRPNNSAHPKQNHQ